MCYETTQKVRTTFTGDKLSILYMGAPLIQTVMFGSYPYPSFFKTDHYFDLFFRDSRNKEAWQKGFDQLVLQIGIT